MYSHEQYNETIQKKKKLQYKVLERFSEWVSLKAKIQEVSNISSSFIYDHESEITKFNHTLKSLDALKKTKFDRHKGLQLSNLKLLKEEDDRKQTIALKKNNIFSLKHEFENRTAKINLISLFLRQMQLAFNELTDYSRRINAYRYIIEGQRKETFDRIQEICGNLRVYCRLRPLTNSELKNKQEQIDFLIDKDFQRLTVSVYDNKKYNLAGISESTYNFVFDYIFGPLSSQSDVYRNMYQLIQSVLDGYNVTLFAYGQTGSGKTYTMEGIIPLSVKSIFDSLETLEYSSWSYNVEISIFEIYNETIRDLLRSLNGSLNDPNDKKHSQSCEIKLDVKGNIIVSNIKSVPVKTINEIIELLKISQKYRMVAATACNDQSSRSHSIFQLKIAKRRKLDDKVTTSVLSFVDLAGSERLEKSQATGARLKEAQHINKSLSCLYDVINAIYFQKSHIPFRNSKLTLLLKDSLGGKSKTLLIVNLSSLKKNWSESLNSLRFATKANSCVLS